ncbi:putative uncharacterized protein LOC103989588 isoform X1 [Chlorella sorokiniana]|uniref:Uncharacterized protein n=1 Tax=Chlorella sorokiniana TaxID=3076 RepID=A0A2P6TYX1_CHLSO|nr:putative uncharacterized protein LOC103989588 isoform X1 [Chlorella sorokiniana]|eukprot:PRW59261.1 putative uncharacterized protein LOC103989588 isoform X1 [Chlorella sorokiniana]
MLRRLLCCLAPRSKQRDKGAGDGGSAAAAAVAAKALADAARASAHSHPLPPDSEDAPRPSSPSAEFSFKLPHGLAAQQEPASPLLTPGGAGTPATSLTPDLFRRSATPLGASNTQQLAGTPMLFGGHKAVLASSCTPSSLMPEPRFLFDVAYSSTSPHVTGIPNSVAKYAQEQPVRIHTTPIEHRIERALKAEQRAVRRAKAARAAGSGS